MPDYSLGKIYKITSEHTEQFYIGSTCVPLLSHRLRGHVSAYNEWIAGKPKNFSSFRIIEPCRNTDELRAREQHHIRANKELCCNVRKALLTAEELAEQRKLDIDRWRNDNPEKIRQQNTEYYQRNAETIKAYQKTYSLANKEKLKARTNQKHQCICGGHFTYAEHTQRGDSQAHYTVW
jgi:hypothetical protein